MDELLETFEDIIEITFAKSMGKKHIDKIEDVWTQILLGKYEAKKPEDRLSCSKKFKSSKMPPCQKVLWQIKRTHLTTRRWVSSTWAHPPNDNPKDFGFGY